MKLISCHVENFGILSGADYNFTEGLNVICKENGAGKSTLAAFIKAMFYGLEGDGKRDEFSSERKRFAPWQGGAFGGSLIFETKGKTYQILRTFMAKASEDIFELRDYSTNLVSKDFTEKIGEELFHINGESFLRTVFIKQNDCHNSGATDDINAKLGNISDGLDLNNFAKADTALKNAINAYSASRKTGEVSKLSSDISLLKARISNNESVEEALNTVKTRIHDAKVEIDRVKAELNSINDLRRAAAQNEVLLRDRETFLSLSEDLKKRQEDLDKRKSFFTKEVPDITTCKEWEEAGEELIRLDGVIGSTRLYDAEKDLYSSFVGTFRDGVPSEEKIASLSAEASELTKLRGLSGKYGLSEEEGDSLSDYKDRFGEIKDAEIEINEAIDKWNLRAKLISEENSLYKEYNDLKDINDRKSSKGKTGKILFCVLGLVLIACGVIALSSILPLGIVLCASGLVLILVGILKKHKHTDSEEMLLIKEKLDSLSEALDETEDLVKGILEDNEIDYDEDMAGKALNDLSKELYEYKILLKKEQDAHLNDYSDRCNALAKDINDFLLTYNISATEDEYLKKLTELSGNARHFESLSVKAKNNAEAKDKKAEVLKYLEGSLARFGFSLGLDPVKTIGNIFDVVTEYNSLLTYYNEANAKLAGFVNEHDISALENIDDNADSSSLAAVTEREDELNDVLFKLQDSVVTDTRTMDTYTIRYEELCDDREMLETMTEELKEKKKRLEYMKKAQEFLGEAKEKLTARYMEPLLSGYKKYYSVLTGDDGSSYHIDANMNITREEKGRHRSTLSLSSGYRDLIGFCMRLSVADAMYTDEKPMLILDDPFVNLDNKKMEGAKEVLAKAASQYQVIYLSCREDRI